MQLGNKKQVSFKMYLIDASEIFLVNREMQSILTLENFDMHQ